MTLAELWAWLWAGHRHAPVSTGLAPAITGDHWRAQLVEVDRCACGAVRPVGETSRWTMPLEDGL